MISQVGMTLVEREFKNRWKEKSLFFGPPVSIQSFATALPQLIRVESESKQKQKRAPKAVFGGWPWTREGQWATAQSTHSSARAKMLDCSVLLKAHRHPAFNALVDGIFCPS